MSDLEQQLTGVLAEVSERAPDVSGLADGARRRHRVRRQRRLALGAGVAAVAVVVGAVAVAGGGHDRAADPVDDPPPSGWQTVEADGGSAFVSLPADWTSVRCGDGDDALLVHGPGDHDVCADGVGAVFLPSGARGDTEQGAVVSTDGGWLGYVHAGDQEVRVFHQDRELVRRILITTRLEGQPVVDGSSWVGFDRTGLTYEVPAWWGLGPAADLDAYSVCVLPPGSPELDETGAAKDRYVLTEQPGPGGVVRVAAPTQAVAELVMATVDASEAVVSADCGPEDFSTGLLPGESTPGSGTPVEGHERAVELPTSDWEPGDPSDDALITGVLGLGPDGCVVLRTTDDPRVVGYALWPAGFSATAGTDGLVLRGPDGAVVAREGDRIEAGGGWRTGLPEGRCLPAGGLQIAMIQSEVTVRH